jgi:hypothetical protein
MKKNKKIGCTPHCSLCSENPETTSFLAQNFNSAARNGFTYGSKETKIP